MKLGHDELLRIIADEFTHSVGGENSNYIDANRRAALAMYLGQPDGKEVAGRSAVISTDVADAIEWILPEIVKAFTQNNEVVTFDPCYEGDEDQAELESKYVYDILMKDNNGFLILHQFIKDALLQKNGFLKVYYDKTVERFKESYTGLTDVEMQLVLADRDVELAEHTKYEIEGIPFSDVKVIRTVDSSKVCVQSVPPEEFRVRSTHNSVDLSKAQFSAHSMLVTEGYLVSKGFDKRLVQSLPTYQDTTSSRTYRFTVQGEDVSSMVNETDNPASRLIEISECYMYLDVDDTCIPELYKITVAGGDEPTHVLDQEPIDENPFISSTAILMSHKLFGLSIYDRLKQIQEQKTTLWRNILDNMYLQNNQRTVILDGQVNVDDVLLSRPGGIIRAKTAGAVTPYITPPLPSDVYKMMDYLDQVRAGRSGASPEGPITDSMIGDRVGSMGVERMMSQKEELVGLMIRVLAETGVKPLCYMIRNQVIRHQDVARDYMFRGKWIKVNPKKWRNRSHTTVRVGTGSGNRREQLSAIVQIMSIQEKILANPSQTLVTEAEVFSAANDFAKFSGMPGVRKYLIDPSSPEGKKMRADKDQSSKVAQEAAMKEKQIMLDAQMKIANAQEQLTRIEGMNVQLKSQNEATKAQLKAMEQASQARTDQLTQQLEQAKEVIRTITANKELQFKYYQADQVYDIELRKLNQSEALESGVNPEKVGEDE